MSDGEQTRLRFFHQFSADLARFRPDLAGRYVCPICLADFPEEAVFGNQPRLTIEDCIPKGLGPTSIALTCQTCNNTAGSMIDSHLHKRLEFEAFFKATQQESVSGRLSYEGLDVGVEICRTGGSNPRTDIKIIGEQSHKEFMVLIQEAMKHDVVSRGKPNEMQLHFGPRTVPNNTKSLTALLKAGYLLLFRTVGYGLILSPHLDRIRQQIRDPESNSVNVVSLVLRLPRPVPSTLSIIKRGPRGIAVPVPINEAPTIVILPANEASYALWDDLCQRQLESGVHGATYTFTPLPHVVWPEEDDPNDIDPPDS